MAEAAIRIGFVDKELLDKTLSEYIAEIEAAIDRCYDCIDEVCPKHEQMIEDMKGNYAALALGMLKVEVIA